MRYTPMRCTPMRYTLIRYTLNPVRCTPTRYTPMRHTLIEVHVYEIRLPSIFWRWARMLRSRTFTGGRHCYGQRRRGIRPLPRRCWTTAPI